MSIALKKIRFVNLRHAKATTVLCKTIYIDFESKNTYYQFYN